MIYEGLSNPKLAFKDTLGGRIMHKEYMFLVSKLGQLAVFRGKEVVSMAHCCNGRWSGYKSVRSGHFSLLLLQKYNITI